MELLKCPVCQFLLCEPVTVSCGHSFCRQCIMGLWVQPKCLVCEERLKQKNVKEVNNNVLVSAIIEKCFPQETEIKEKLKNGDFMEALRKAETAIKMAPDDVSLKVWRAEACFGLQRFSDALRDLEDLCCAKPDWTEGFFRKGNVLLEMGMKTEALVQFNCCLKQQPNFEAAKNQIKILELEGVPIPEEIPQISHVVNDSSSMTKPLDSTVESNLSCSIQLDKKPDSYQSDSRPECCLSLCQSVPLLSTKAEVDEELMIKEENSQTRGSCSVDLFVKVLALSDFECPLCIRLFYEPVTTPCGHTFCKTCIERSLDHNLRCPLCKQPLQEYLRNRKYNPTMLLQEIMTRLFPEQLAERTAVHDAEMAELSNLTKDIPIFVCTVAYPGIPCPLHVFEPRYRLMMRRCMETGTKKFGMCSYEHGKGFADYGCMLEIQDQNVLSDGRSYVETVGVRRFRVLSRGQRDGYHTADIEYLQDHEVQDSEFRRLQCLHDSVYQQAREWYQRLSDHNREQISGQFGPMPEREDNIQASTDGPAWCWWLLSVLQLDPAYQTTILSMTSLKDRLGHLRIVLEYFSQR